MIYNISDINLWELGTTALELQNKTWEQIKNNSDTRIRTKNLFPCSSSLKVKISSNYNIDLLWFNEEGLMISEIETNWMRGTNNEFISVSVPNDAKQVGILVKFTDNINISPSEILNTNIYYDDGLSNNSIIAENIINIMIGEILALKMYFGDDLIWEYNSLPNYFKFKALETGTFTLTIPTYVYSSKIESVSYSVDNGETWVTTLNSNENIVITTPTILLGNEVLWKGSGKSLAGNGNSASFSTFSSTGNFEISGNIMSMLYEDDFEERVSLEQSYNFCKLFYNCTKLIDASKLELPATTLANDCYNSMFYGCTNLLNTPELPALTLTNNCYSSMFYGCSSLTKTPQLPALTLALRCYGNMFYGCTNIATVSTLPATTLLDYCYIDMFRGCAKLVTGPELPATNLSKGCYLEMFYGCNSLTSISNNILPATVAAVECYRNMFALCKSLVTSPQLSITTLDVGCYRSMFLGCSSLVNIPQLPTTVLKENCYAGMFLGCTSITASPALPATTLTNYCYNAMFLGCTNLITAPQLPATTLATECYKSMFELCTKLTIAPELPATTLTDGCYSYMFSKCYKLTQAPELNASTLVTNCYREMFNSCSVLNLIKCLAEDISASNCTNKWVNSVSSTGEFIGISTTSWERGVNGIPTNWTLTDNSSQ